MTAGGRRSLVGAFAVLSVIGLFRSCGRLDEAYPTTHGTAPWGLGAFYELSARLWPGTTRARGVDVRPPAAVWWLPRAAACVEKSPSAAVPWPLTGWVEAGGTVVVPLPGRGERLCTVGRDVALPTRTPSAADGAATVDGPGVLARSRELVRAPRVFEAPGEDWHVRVRANGGPLVIERRLGTGRLVAIADASFLTNAELGRGDAAPLAAELAGAWGPPAFDDGTTERATGGPLGYVVRSAGIVPLIALALVGLVVAWYGALVPPRPPAPDGPPAPQLDDFVRSLGRLHRRSRDWTGLLARHRAWAVAALAPRLGLPPHAPTDAVLARLRTLHGAASAAPLEDATPVSTERDLARRFAAVAAVVEDVVS